MIGEFKGKQALIICLSLHFVPMLWLKIQALDPECEQKITH
jgi:hypothetical protein